MFDPKVFSATVSKGDIFSDSDSSESFEPIVELVESSKSTEPSDSPESDSSKPVAESSESNKPFGPLYTSDSVRYATEKIMSDLSKMTLEELRENNGKEKDKKLKDLPKLSWEEVQKFAYDNRIKIPSKNLLERKEILDGFIFYFKEFKKRETQFLVLSRALDLFFNKPELLGTIDDSKEKESEEDSLKACLRLKLKKLYKLPCKNRNMKNELRALFLFISDNNFLIRQLRCFSAGMMSACGFSLNPDYISSDNYETRSNKKWAELYRQVQKRSLPADVTPLQKMIEKERIAHPENKFCEMEHKYFNLLFPNYAFNLLPWKKIVDFVYGERTREAIFDHEIASSKCLQKELVECDQLLEGIFFYFEKFDKDLDKMRVLESVLGLFINNPSYLGSIVDSMEKVKEKSVEESLMNGLRNKLEKLFSLCCLNDASRREVKAIFSSIPDNAALIRQLGRIFGGIIRAYKILPHNDEGDSYEIRSDKKWYKLYRKQQLDDLKEKDARKLLKWVLLMKNRVQENEREIWKEDRSYIDLFLNRTFKIDTV